ncbi:hypothetical protein QA942_33480 [Streptomyces sp. B21-106]|uniref:hypothetical protein n=1 Tax=Streptomyces sp. B21-106 TaxID=3039418 RepID=UPI002FEFFDF9
MVHRLHLIRQRALRRADRARTAREVPTARAGSSAAIPPARDESYAPVTYEWTPPVDDYRISAH